MPKSRTRALAELFYKACAGRDVETAVSCLAKDVDWLVQGPVDVFGFLGQRHGRDAVRQGFCEIARKLEVTGYQREALLVEENKPRLLLRQRGQLRHLLYTRAAPWCPEIDHDRLAP